MPAIPVDHRNPNDIAGSGPPTGYEPDEAEQRAIKLAGRLFSDAKRAKEAVDSKWVENYKFFRGKQWPEKRPTYRHSEVLNFIFSEVQTVLVLLTDARPNIDYLPEDPSDREFAEILSQIVRSKWDRNAWSMVLAEAIVDASIYGTAIAGVPWKPKLHNGLGDFVFETEDPFHIFPDPDARSKVNDEYCKYIVRAKPRPVESVKADYPEKADFIRADIGDLAQQSGAGQADDQVHYKSPSDNRVLVESDRSVHPGKPGQVLEICVYLKSEEMIEEQVGEEPDPETGATKKLYQTRKKYPNGRKIVVANGVLLEDRGDVSKGEGYPYENGLFPFARLVDHAMPREFWGVGEIENLRSPQMIINKLISYVLDVLTLMGNPIWVVDTNSGVDTDNLTNQPGLVVEKHPNTTVDRKEGVQLQPFVLQTLELMIERIMGKLGSTQEVSKGVAPSADSSGYAIAQLQEAAQTRIRGKSRNVEEFLKEVGGLVADRILQFYTMPRVVRITNNQNAHQYFKFHVEEKADESGNVQKTAHILPLDRDDMGNPVEGPPIAVPIKSKMDVRFNVGSSLPFAKLESRTLAEKLYDKQIIDAEEYLTQLEYPNRERIIQRLKERQAMMPPEGAQDGGAAAPGPA